MRSFISLLLIIPVLCLTGCKFSKEINANYIKSYTDIPGITEDERTAIEWIKSEGISFSYGHTLETEAFMQTDGSFTGFTYKFCDLLSTLFEIEFIPRYYESWSDLKKELDAKELDFTGELTPTSERFDKYYMTHAIAERSLKLFTLKNSLISRDTDIHRLNVGFLADTITADFIHKAYPITFTVVDVSDIADAAQKLKDGTVSAVITEAIADPAFSEYDFIRSEDAFPLVFAPVAMATANQYLKPVISVVNKYLSSGGITRLLELHNEGDFEYAMHKLINSFTYKERMYIIRNGPVMVAFENDNYPISFYNETEKEYQGIAVDVLAEIGRLTGLNFMPADTKDLSWFEIMRLLKSGGVSMISHLLHSDELTDEYIWSDDPYFITNYALLSKSGYPTLTLPQVVLAKVGIVKHSLYEQMYNTWFPHNDNTIGYDTQDEALKAMASGEVDLLMLSEAALLTQTSYRKEPDYKVNVNLNTPMDALFGFNKSEAVLCSIINKSQAFIKTEAIASDWTSRSFDYASRLANLRAAYFAVFASALLMATLALLLILAKNRRLSRDLERQTRAKSEFLARMSHEIRTPLNAVIGMSVILRNSIDDRQKTFTLIDKILSSSRHLLGIINDVLDMSKIESGKLSLASEAFWLMDAYSEVSSIITQRCLEKDISLVTNVSEIGNTNLIGDKLRLNQILINLLGNAVKFTPEGGRIEFLVEILQEDEKSIRLNYLIADNGIGMSEEQMSRLFMPFEQTDNSIAGKFGGTGLGLSISQKLVNMMGGTIKAESKQGMGSKFWFDVCFEKNDSYIEDSEAPDVPDLSGKRLLVVEDIEVNRFIMSELLSPTDAEIFEAENGKQAVEMFERSEAGYYSMILMDIQMPIMDGYEATERIRTSKHADAKSVPIIAMTANAYREDAKHAIDAGMNGHLAKPIDINLLMLTLAQETFDGSCP